MTEPSIRVVRGGPLLVRDLELRRIAGSELGPDLSPGASYALCRCGASGSMPFCDREAPYACFEEEPPTRALDKLPAWDVPDPSVPCVALKTNGPVRVAGDVVVTRDDDASIQSHGGRRSLCRCGASACQPLCDGSHKVAPFVDP